jgi:uncharacterized protein
VSLFEYDPVSPLETLSIQVGERTQEQLCDLSYRVGEREDRVQAWLIIPKIPTPSSYAVFLHGGGQERGAFLNEAYLLAENGFASLLIDLPQARMFPRFSHPEEALISFHRTVVSVRRGIDCLACCSDIDQTRGAIIGFSFGAWMGSIVAAVDQRVRAAVLTAVVPRMSEFWTTNINPEVVRIRAALPSGTMERYAHMTRFIDVLEHLDKREDLQWFFQLGSGDEFMNQDSIGEFSSHAKGKNALRVYECGSHFEMFLHPDARHDRLSWLQDQLVS